MALEVEVIREIRPVLAHSPMFWVEVAYALIIAISCFIVFSRTRKLYSISSYKGIKYFGNAFVFFGIAFIARFVFRSFAIIDGPSQGDFILFILGYLVSIYAGLMAGFYLIYSSAWKELEDSDRFGWLMHPIAVTLSALLIIYLFEARALLILALMFALAYYITYSKSKNGKGKGYGKMHVLYGLLFGAWISNVATHVFFGPTLAFSIAMYVLSSALFITILYRVIRSTK